MKKKNLLLRLAVLVTAMMCALGAAAVEAYANYTPSNTTLTFYYDNYRSSRTGTTYDLNPASTHPGWETDGTNANVTKVVFDPSFADARPVTTFYWFEHMENLTDITGMSYLNTSEVTSMLHMFYYCSNLTSVDVSHLNTSKVISMSGMFGYCDNLTSLDLSNWNTSKVNSMSYMFCFCGNLQTIYVGSGWSTDAVTSSGAMFSMCTSLVGGQGTAYNSSNPKDKTYAHIDGGPSNPGYFTAPPEAYACYTSSNTTLTFYYDNYRNSRPGTTYDLNTGSNDTGWDTDGTNASVTKVVFDPSFAGARPTTTCDWFYYMHNLESITGMEYLNTSEVTNMNWMFMTCSKLTSLDVSHFNTSKVMYMTQMFSGCTGLTSLDLSSFNTSKVAYMRYTFNNSTNLRTIYVGDGWSTAAVTESINMFSGCTSLVGGKGTTYDANHIDATYAHIDGGPSNPGYFTDKNAPVAYACYTPSNTTLTFYYDNQRSSRTGTTYDLNTGTNNPGWESDGTYASVTKVVFDPSFAGARPTTTCKWFFYMLNLQSITGMEYLNTSEVTNMVFMFDDCIKLSSLDLSHFNMSKVTNMASMFNSCTGLTSLDLSSFNTSNVNIMNYMFFGCTNLRTIYVGGGWSTAAVTSSVSMFTNCTSLVGGQGTTYDANHVDKTYAHIDGGTSNPGYFTDGNGPRPYACYTPSNTTLTFYYDNQRSSRTGTTYDLNTGSNDTGWDTDGTKDYVTKVVFDPSFAGARPTTTYDWFYGMQNLESITGLSYLNTSEVTNMGWMFTGCNQLTSIDVSHFNTSQVTKMDGMLGYCQSLTSLDLSSFNTSQVISMSSMFDHCANLQTIYVGDGWNTAAVTISQDMFKDCTSLVGGQGTTYNSSNPKDKTYAHIDGGPSNPGYFTAKNAFQLGDVNRDGQINIADVTTLISMVLRGNATAASNPEADLTGDGSLNIADVTTLISIVLRGA